MLAVRAFYMTETIYIALEEEGVAVRRPARAYRREDGRYIVLRPAAYDPAAETWRFPPGSTVEVERQETAGGEILAAVREVLEEDKGRRAV